jgi:hypothetical protein
MEIQSSSFPYVLCIEYKTPFEIKNKTNVKYNHVEVFISQSEKNEELSTF